MIADPSSIVLPLAMTMAVVGTGVARARRARRRRAVERALHELRRPLQILALGAPRSTEGEATPVDLALTALEDLDAAIRGSTAPGRPRPVSARALVTSAVERWRGPAARAGKALRLSWEAGSAMVLADPGRIGRALDNLLANAIEHGGLRVSVSARVLGSRIRVEVSDRGRPEMPGVPRAPARSRGHGLPIVAGIAREHGGRLALAHSSSGMVAILELPLEPSAIESLTA